MLTLSAKKVRLSADPCWSLRMITVCWMLEDLGLDQQDKGSYNTEYQDWFSTNQQDTSKHSDQPCRHVSRLCFCVNRS